MTRIWGLLLLTVLIGCQKEKRAPSLSNLGGADSVVPDTAPPPLLNPEMRGLFEEANRRFTYKGEPISPFGVRELMEWASDRNPGPVAMNLAGVHGSGRYHGPVTVDPQTGAVTAPNPPDPADPEPVEDGTGYFSYRRMGLLNNGWHVLRVSDNDGGPGVFEALLLVQFRVDTEYNAAAEPRLIMERRGSIPLGDRYKGAIRVKGDSISVTADLVSGYQTVDRTFGFRGVE